ncbi:hypothetical protein P9112_001895 [Eukaryota sp. TZLM1-RC]
MDYVSSDIESRILQEQARLKSLQSELDSIPQPPQDLCSLNTILEQLGLDSNGLDLPPHVSNKHNLLKQCLTSFSSSQSRSHDLTSSNLSSLTIPPSPPQSLSTTCQTTTSTVPKKPKLNSIDVQTTPQTDTQHVPQQLTATKKQSITSSHAYRSFLSSACSTVEKVLTSTQSLKENASRSNPLSPTFLSYLATFSLPESLSSFIPTSISTSFSSTSFLVSLCSTSTTPSHLPNGQILLYTLDQLYSPLCTLSCPFPVTVACFDKELPHLVVGGCSNGQLFVWDLRNSTQNNSLNPVIWTNYEEDEAFLSITSVTSLSNGNICSISADGKLIIRSVETLKKIWQFEVESDQLLKMAISDVSFNVFIGNRNSVVLVNQSLEESRVITEGIGNVEDLDCLHLEELVSGDLLLITYSNWTWHLLLVTSTQTVQLLSNSYSFPLFSCKWNSFFPLVFAICLGNGVIEIWSLTHSIETPLYKEAVNKPLSSLDWSFDGSKLFLIDLDGCSYVLEGFDFDGGNNELFLGLLPDLTQKD